MAFHPEVPWLTRYLHGETGSGKSSMVSAGARTRGSRTEWLLNASPVYGEKRGCVFGVMCSFGSQKVEQGSTCPKDSLPGKYGLSE